MGDAKYDVAWSFEDLSREVCSIMVAKGKLKEKPAFIRTDREKKLAQCFEKAGLDGAKMAEINSRLVEVAIGGVTEGEAWVDDVQDALKGMLDSEAAASTTGPAESADMKAIREAVIERAKSDNPDGAPPAAGGRACFNCGQTGHVSRDCPEPRQEGGKGGGGGYRQDDEAYSSFGGRSGGGGRDLECYNCGQVGHISRDCPEPRQEGGRGGGGGYRQDDEAYGSFGGRSGGGGRDQACYNCGQVGHISRDCPEPRQERRDGGGGGYEGGSRGGGGDW